MSDGATWLGRVLSTLGLAVLFGSLALIIAAWPEGPEYILAVRFLRSVWLLTLAGTLLYVVALSAAVRDESLGSGLNPAGWLDLLDAGWPGRAALARLVLVIACAWVVMRPERVIDPTTQLPAIAIPTLAVVTIGLSRTGGDLAIIGVIAGITHALAMAVWVGGVVLLARVVLAGPGEEDLVHAVRGFGRISGPAIVITVVSGLVQLFRLDGGSLFSEPHGRVLLLKTVFVALMLFVGLTARQVAQARLARAGDLTAPTADRLRRAFGTEAAIGVVVLGLSGWLLSFTPAKIDDPGSLDYAIEETIVDPVNGLDVTVSLEPGRVGLNALARGGARAGERHHRTGAVVRPAVELRCGDDRAADPAQRAWRRRVGRERGHPAAGGRRVDAAGQRDHADRHVVGRQQPIRRAHRRRRSRHPRDRLHPHPTRRHRNIDHDQHHSHDDRGLSPFECLKVGRRSSSTPMDSNTRMGSGLGDELAERDGRGDVELVVAAARRLAVGTPADERHAVAEPPLLQLPERHLGHPLDADRHPGQVLAGVPPARRPRLACLVGVLPLGPVAPWVVVHGVVGERLQLGEQLAAEGNGERRSHSDVLQPIRRRRTARAAASPRPRRPCGCGTRRQRSRPSARA